MAIVITIAGQLLRQPIRQQDAVYVPPNTAYAENNNTNMPNTKTDLYKLKNNTRTQVNIKTATE